MPWDDEILVAGLKEHNGDAVQYAVETYAPKLYRYAMYQLGNAEAAEDLVSEVVARMIEKIDGYNYNGTPFQAWLFQIARNLVSDSYRLKRKAHVTSLDEWLDMEQDSDKGAPDHRIESLGDREVLLAVMAQLTGEQRQVIYLRIIEGWQPSEIAQLLDKSIDSVKSLQYRALRAMRRHLEQDTERDIRAYTEADKRKGKR